MTANTRVSHAVASIETLRFLGGHLCLDFTNTVDPRMGKQALDYLADYYNLLKWSQCAGVVSGDEAQHLEERARHHPAKAATAWQRAVALREVIYRIFSAVASGANPPRDDLAALSNAFAEAMTHAQIIPMHEGFAWEWITSEQAFDSVLWPIVRAAVDLLTSENVKRVKQCPGLDDCGWLFLDMSKNGSRQWCSMEGCGSRAKMRHLYARKRAEIKSNPEKRV
jgi:predicted RNA-binding Zn ribbon-like protein